MAEQPDGLAVHQVDAKPVHHTALIVVALCLGLVGACAPTLEEMRASFYESYIEDSIGRPLETLSSFGGHNGEGRYPTAKHKLDNGNTLYEYGQFWRQIGLERGPCTLYLEVNPKTGVVVDGHTEGGGCFSII